MDQLRFRAGYLNDEERGAFQNAFYRIMQAPLFLDDSAINLEQLRSKLNRLRATQDLGLVVVDCLQLKGPGEFESRAEEISYLSRGLKLMSKELRVPFLDIEVFAVASSIPTSLKLTNQTTKYALRRAIADIVPPHVLERPKLGFPVPIRHWLKDTMYEWARAIITDSQADAFIDRDRALALLEAHRAGPHDYSRKIWRLLVFMIWHGIFIEERIRPELPDPVSPVR